MSKIIIMVAYVRGTGVIGIGTELPWGRGLKSDLENFKNTTTGHVLIVGRITYETFRKPLRDRDTVILTSDPNYQPIGVSDENRHLVHVRTSFEEAVAKAKELAGDTKDIFIIGGEQVYTEALYDSSIQISKIIATEVDADIDGDKYFPLGTINQQIADGEWREIPSGFEPQEANDRNVYSFIVRTWQHTAD